MINLAFKFAFSLSACFGMVFASIDHTNGGDWAFPAYLSIFSLISAIVMGETK